MNNNLIKQIGFAVNRIRREKGLGIKVMADSIGVSRAWWSSLEQGRLNDIGILRLLEVARVLGVDPRALIPADLF